MNAVPRDAAGASPSSPPTAPSLDPGTATARERLDEALGDDLARKLVFALTGAAAEARERRERADGPSRPGRLRRVGGRRARSRANETSAITIANAPDAPIATSPK